MLKARWPQQLLQYLLCILAFAIPLPFVFGAIAIVLLSAGWLLQLNPKETLVNIKERTALWPWFIFFILHAISYFYSQDKHQSLFDLQSKLSFVILPLIVGTSNNISSKLVERIFVSFISGVTIIAIYSITKSGLLLLQTHDIQSLFYEKLVAGLDANAVTQAWYTIFSLSILMFVHWENYFQRKYNYLKIILIIILTCFLVLLSARMLIVLYFFFVIPYYLLKTINLFSKTRLTIISLAVTILAGLLVFTNNPVKKRYQDIFKINLDQSFLTDYHHVAEGDFSNLTLRVFFWRIGIENMNEQHLWLKGAGNGDVYKLQNDKMYQYGMNIYPPVAAWRSPFYNANLHNMYLQSLLMLGIGGVVIFLLISVTPFFKLRKIKYNRVFFIFNVISVCVMMLEAALQSQAGIIYYTFFIQLFWAIYYCQKSINKKLITP